MSEKTYMLRVWNTFSNTYDMVEVTQEIYNEYRRSYWREEKSDTQYQNKTLPLYETMLSGTRMEFIDPADIFEKSACMEVLSSALGQLNKNECALFRALFIDGLTEAQYAQKLGVSQQAVNRQKQRLKRRLRKMLRQGC